MWSRKHENCQSCNSALFEHKARGLCTMCYRVDRKKSKMENELNDLSDYVIFETKRPLLPHFYWSCNKRDQIISAILEQEESKLHYLKIYGRLESGEMKPSLLNFEFIFNEISKRFRKGNNFYTQKLHTLHYSLNEEQRKLVIMHLTKVLVK